MLVSNKSRLTFLFIDCTSGLGLGLMRLALAHGHSVVATSCEPGNTPELVNEVEAHEHCSWKLLNVSHSVGNLFIDNLEKNGNAIDVLIYNSIENEHEVESSKYLTSGGIRKHLDMSFFVPCQLMFSVIPYMRKRGRGVIVDVSSAIVEVPIQRITWTGSTSTVTSDTALPDRSFSHEDTYPSPGFSFIRSRRNGYQAPGKAALYSILQLMGNQLVPNNIHVLYNIVYTSRGEDDSCARNIFVDIVKKASPKELQCVGKNHNETERKNHSFLLPLRRSMTTLGE